MEREKKVLERKVGIIGYWFATNYGGVSSYFSLYQAISKLGYSPFLVENPYFKVDKEGENVFSKNFFKNENCTISNGFENNELNKLNDLSNIFLLGSDQVLTSNSIKAFGKLFLMEFATPDKKRIAYSASFGGDNLDADNNVIARINSQLKLFSDLSVREYSGVNLMWNKFGLRTEVLADPIFFTSAEEFRKLGEKAADIISDDYVLAYILDPTEDKKECIKFLSDRLKINCRIALDGRKFTHDTNATKINMSDSVLPELDLYQWLKYYSHAKYIFTDSFHGAVMALILNKPFIIYVNKERGYPRFITLGKMFGIEDRLIEKFSELTDEIIIKKIDFNYINKQIENEAKKGIQWLNNALDTKYLKNCIEYNLDIKNKCTGCGACANACPVEAIELQTNPDGFVNPVVNKTKCIDCGICSKKCIALHPIYKNNPNPKCFAVWAKDEIRAISSSGGAFTVAAEYILSHKGVVCGAVFDENFNVYHTIITDKKDLDRIRGSKYYQSKIGNIYRQIKSYLDHDTYVLFTGMPCQVAGLYSFLGKNYSKLYTVDILCHGISSYKVFDKYRKDVLNNKKLIDLKFKAKKPWGWHAGVNARFDDGSTYSKIIEEDPYYIAYIQGLSKNKPCGTCLFNRLPRQGDLTFGDFWKVQDFKKSLNDNKGTSVVLANNEHGIELFKLISPDFPVKEEVPLSYAIAGNGIIKYPYTLNINRDAFFRNLDNNDFTSLINLYRKQKQLDISTIPKNLREYYYIAEIVKQNIGSRKLILWGDNFEFRNFLSNYYSIKTEFILTVNMPAVNNKTIRYFDDIRNKASEYYVVVMGKAFTLVDYNKFKEYGFSPLKDFIYRMINPIVLENFDLSKGYSDDFGNRIEKSNGVVKRIIFRGYNNKISIKLNVWNLNNLRIDLSANSVISIGENTNFTQPDVVIETRGYDGTAKVEIGKSCIFMDTLFRLYLHRAESLVLINSHTTFGEKVSLRANQGKKIIIGKDCMFSSHIELWAGDGHTIMDVKTKSPINLFADHGNPKNKIVFGDHTWVGYRSIVMGGTNIGDGSIIGAQSVVKGIFPNNCSVAGSPAKIIKTDVAWSRDMVTNDIKRCNGYANFTSKSSAPISGQDVLVVGGTRAMGTQLVNRLLELGNNVTIATRGRTPDNFGNMINRIKLDVTDFNSVKTALHGSKFDYVFDDVAYNPVNVYNLISNIEAKKYIQLSSVMAYGIFKPDIEENELTLPKSISLNDWSIEKRKHMDSKYLYVYGKRYAEAEAYNLAKMPVISIRIPYVFDMRPMYYCEHILSGTPMYVKELNKNLIFVRAEDVGKFLPWIAAQDYEGPINFSNRGTISIKDIITYIEKKVNKKAIYGDSNNYNDKEPFNEFDETSFSFDLRIVSTLGYNLTNLHDWFWRGIDKCIENALNKK